MSENPAHAIVFRFRYLGHRQVGMLRELSFGEMGRDGYEHMLQLKLDIGLLTKHRLHLQDAPNICLRVLAERWYGLEPPGGYPTSITISDRDLTQLFGDGTPAEPAKKNKKRRP